MTVMLSNRLKTNRIKKLRIVGGDAQTHRHQSDLISLLSIGLHLVVTVSHYMFRPIWPSSGV
jgi:hypothetical protein